VILVLGMFMTSLCTKYWQILLAQGLMMGLGMGCLFTPATGLIAQYFSRRRGLALGIVSTGSTIGSISWPYLVCILMLPRRNYLPSHVSQTCRPHWVWMVDTNFSFCHLGHIDTSSARHKSTYQAVSSAEIVYQLRLEREAVQSFCCQFLHGICGALHPVFLHSAILRRQIHRNWRIQLLSAAHHECIWVFRAFGTY
jgi:nitrate/nitrite transporter NarK